MLDALSSDELKLYIIFLLFARGVQIKETIDFGTIKRAFGDITVKRLKNACNSLMKKGMVKVRFSEVKREALANNSFINFTIEYELHTLLSWQRIEEEKGG
ncbi:MAG: hypothetical protein ACE5IH_05330 [Thermodesulfobacteriota bacterium]